MGFFLQEKAASHSLEIEPTFKAQKELMQVSPVGQARH
jgi:hypothetical protein